MPQRVHVCRRRQHRRVVAFALVQAPRPGASRFVPVSAAARLNVPAWWLVAGGLSDADGETRFAAICVPLASRRWSARHRAVFGWVFR